MPRVKKLLVCLGTLAIVLGPAPRPTQAQTPNLDFTLTGGTVGRMDTPVGLAAPGLTNRVAGPRLLSGDLALAVTCRTSTGNEVVTLASLEQPAGYSVSFWADEDITDGFGEITATTTGRSFTSTTAIGVRDDNVSPMTETVRLDVVGGRFHRLANQVEVDLTVTVRVADLATGGVQCQTRSATPVPLRTMLTLVPDEDTRPTAGFLFLGVVTRHQPGDPAIVRPICEQLTPLTIRVLDAEVCPPPYGGA